MGFLFIMLHAPSASEVAAWHAGSNDSNDAQDCSAQAVSLEAQMHAHAEAHSQAAVQAQSMVARAQAHAQAQASAAAQAQSLAMQAQTLSRQAHQLEEQAVVVGSTIGTHEVCEAASCLEVAIVKILISKHHDLSFHAGCFHGTFCNVVNILHGCVLDVQKPHLCRAALWTLDAPFKASASAPVSSSLTLSRHAVYVTNYLKTSNSEWRGCPSDCPPASTILQVEQKRCGLLRVCRGLQCLGL